MRGLLNTLVKELLQLRRDPKILPIVLVAPVVQLIILGYAATTDVKRVELAVCDLDRTPASGQLVQAFVSSGYFRLTGSLPAQPALDELLEAGTARVALTIPAGFGADRAAGRPGQVQLLVDGSDASSGTIGLGYAQAVLAGVALPAGARPPLELRPLILYNPDLLSRNFMVPATLALILLVMTMLLTSMAVVREGEIGTMEQILVTPIRPAQFILGKLFAYSLVGLAEAAFALPVALFWFRVPLRGSVFTLILLTLPFMLCTLGMGLLVSTLARTQQQAMMIAAFLFMIPQIYLSGFVFPIQNMPRLFQWLTYLMPLRYYVTILRGVFLKGVGLDVLWPQGLMLVVLGTTILVLARLRFRRRLG